MSDVEVADVLDEDLRDREIGAARQVAAGVTVGVVGFLVGFGAMLATIVLNVETGIGGAIPTWGLGVVGVVVGTAAAATVGARAAEAIWYTPTERRQRAES